MKSIKNRIFRVTFDILTFLLVLKMELNTNFHDPDALGKTMWVEKIRIFFFSKHDDKSK